MNCPACDHSNVDGARYCASCGAAMPLASNNPSDPLVGTVVGGRYRITRLVGEGGMGRVYLGEQQMGTAVRPVAVKTLLQEFSRDPQVQGRFHRECGTVVGLEHENTIKFYDFGTTDAGDLYIAMEFVDGKPLSDVIRDDGRMTAARVERIMKQVCGSLHEAHEKGIVHRDLKPDNVILTERAGEKDFVKVLDFGIAKRSDAADQAREQKLTQAGMVLGTPPYMSPEQFTGKELDRRSDIYSLAVMAYEMLTGQLPFQANTPWEWATQHMTAQPFPFERTTGELAMQIPGAMKAAILRGLAKNRDERQASARDFFRELAGETEAGPAVSAVAATEAFAMPSQARPGGTQIGEPFAIPGAIGAPMATPPGGTPMGAPVGMPPAAYGPPQPYVGGYPQPYAPPAAPGYATPSPNGGGRARSGAVVVGIGLAAAALVAGGVWFMQQSGDDSEGTAATRLPSATPQLPTSAAPTVGDAPSSDAAANDATTTTGDVQATATAPAAPSPPLPSPVNATGGGTKPAPTAAPTAAPPANACAQVIADAMAGKCAAADAAMSRCTGPQKSIAQANVIRCHQKAAPPPPTKLPLLKNPSRRR